MLGGRSASGISSPYGNSLQEPPGGSGSTLRLVTPDSTISAAVLIPVKSFDLAKGRLAERLSPEERARLARAMARRVIRAAAPLPVWVVCDDAEVADLAIASGASVLWRASRGLNVAVTEGRDFVRDEGIERLVVAHADLPLASDLSWVAGGDGITIVRDRRQDGTNVLSLPTSIPFVFHYGPGSSAAHEAEAERHGIVARVIDDPDLGWDVDVPEDLVALADDLDGLDHDLAVRLHESSKEQHG